MLCEEGMTTVEIMNVVSIPRVPNMQHQQKHKIM
jgi:hypothetical protein